mgnify:CR=1 FL=1
MNVEIERKFLVANQNWRGQEHRSEKVKQGYFARADGYALRVRVANDKAALTIKGKPEGISRAEFQYEISLEEAKELLEKFCKGRIIEKERFFINYEGFLWELDEYFGENKGLFTAEIELERENIEFPKPEWLGKEVSYDYRYSNQNLAERPMRNS